MGAASVSITVSSRSGALSSVIVTTMGFILLWSPGPKVTDFVAMLKSTPSVAVLAASTTTGKVVSTPGR